jgi:hypothetical protein
MMVAGNVVGAAVTCIWRNVGSGDDIAFVCCPIERARHSLATDDAIVLATYLRDSPSVQLALSGYERLHRLERVVAYSAASLRRGPVRSDRWFRDLIMPVALEMFACPTAVA